MITVSRIPICAVTPEKSIVNPIFIGSFGAADKELMISRGQKRPTRKVNNNFLLNDIRFITPSFLE
jgi:hypothetical protein